MAAPPDAGSLIERRKRASVCRTERPLNAQRSLSSRGVAYDAVVDGTPVQRRLVVDTTQKSDLSMWPTATQLLCTDITQLTTAGAANPPHATHGHRVAPPITEPVTSRDLAHK